MFKRFPSLFVFTLALWFAYANLRKDLEQIAATLPIKDIKEVTKYYYENDAEVRQVFNEIKTDEDVKFLVVWIKHQLKYDTDDTDWEKGKTAFDEIMDIFFDDGFTNGLTASAENTNLGGWAAYTEAVRALIPREKVAEIIVQKLAEDAEFAEFYKLAAEKYNPDENLGKPTFRGWNPMKKLKKAWNRLKKKGFNFSWSWPF